MSAGSDINLMITANCLEKSQKKEHLKCSDMNTRTGGEIINNRVLRSKMVLMGITHKELAEEMGINRRVFSNKLARRVVNGYTIQFTDAQKEWLANRFGLDVTEIE